jgi:putative ABC transport system permease protein
MMIVGISGCTALLVTGFGIRDSITNVATQQYTEIQLYDITTTFADTDVKDEIEQLDDLIDSGNISDYCLVMNESVDLVTDSGTKSIYMIVPDPDTVSIGGSDEEGRGSVAGLTSIETYLNLHTTSKEAISYPTGDGVVLTHRIAADYGVSVGDEITLRDSDYDELTLTVTGIAQNFVYNYAFISPEAIESQLGKEPDYLSAWVNVDEGSDLHRAGTKLMKLDGATAVNINQDTMERFVNMMSSLDLIVLVVIVCAAGLAFIVLYNLTNINITERVREIATIKVLGFYENETASYVFRENRILTFLGGCLGLLLGIALHSFVMSNIKVDLIVFDVRIRPISYLYSIVLTMVFAAVINRLMRGKLNSVSMTESLKSVD